MRRVRLIRASDVIANSAEKRPHPPRPTGATRAAARRLRCKCGLKATHVHVTPWLSEDASVEVACPGCDPGGYWFPLHSWFTGDPDWRDASREYTTRDHLLDTKKHGLRVVELLDALIVEGRS